MYATDEGRERDVVFGADSFAGDTSAVIGFDIVPWAVECSVVRFADWWGGIDDGNGHISGIYGEYAGSVKWGLCWYGLGWENAL